MKIKNIIRQLLKGNYDYFFDALSWRLPGWLFYYYHSYLIKSDSPILPTREYTTYYKRFITTDDCELLEKNGYPRKLVESRINAGDRCIIMGKDEEIITIIWAASGERYLKLSGVTLDPGEDGLIVYGGYTKEYARMKGLHPTALTELYKTYLDEGRYRIYSNINILNSYSLLLHKRMNFDIIGENIYIVIMGIGICYFKSWPFPIKKLQIFLKKCTNKVAWV